LGLQACGLSSTCKCCFENSFALCNNLWVWITFFKFSSNCN
jgi:hypothetical protein